MRIGITGSWKTKHAESWGLHSDPTSFKKACRELGEAIAETGAAITVGSDSEFTADKHAVEGYLSRYSSGREVRVVKPNKGSPPFPQLYEEYHDAFYYVTSPSRTWRHTRQLFIADIDALVTVGGGDGTYQAGLELLLTRKRLIPIGSFGGASSRLLSDLLRSDTLGHAKSFQRLANPWVPNLATHVVELLGANQPSTVLLIHGHAKDRVTLKKWLKEEALAKPSVMATEFSVGQTLPEKFESLAEAADAAIALATPDDLGSSRSRTEIKRSRARQNVWVEVGWFWGRLGRDRVLLLVRGDVEIPSDLDGIEYHSYKRSVLEVEPEIRKFLQHVSQRNQ